MWVPELLLPPKIIRMFGPKTAIFAPQTMLSHRPCWLIWCPVGWLVGGGGDKVIGALRLLHTLLYTKRFFRNTFSFQNCSKTTCPPLSSFSGRGAMPALVGGQQWILRNVGIGSFPRRTRMVREVVRNIQPEAYLLIFH